MKHPTLYLLAAAPAVLFFACAKGQLSSTAGTASTGSGGSGGSSGAQCPPCVTDANCAAGSLCGQFAGDTYCAPQCADGQSCSDGRTCTAVNTATGQQVQLCVPPTNVCSGNPSTSSTSSGTTGSTTSSTTSTTSSTSSGGGIPTDCTEANGSVGCCTSTGVLYYCSSGTLKNETCSSGEVCGWEASNNYYGCVSPPAMADPSGTNPLLCGGSSGSTSSSSSSSSSTSSTSSSGSTSSGGPIGPSGGTIPTLNFAVVGDTRPPTEDDPSGYPTAVITKIWQDVEAYNPRPPFAITTGDYMFASPTHTPGTQATQLSTYLTARAAYSNIVFPAMGNHECDGATQDNCGPGTTNCCGSGCYDSNNNSFDVFVQKLLAPINQTLPYYTIKINGTNNAWTAKFVFVACNYWSQAQATWMQQQLAEPTTYTFIVRHEGSDATTAPCLCGTPNAATIMGQYPYTLLIAGHTHTFEAFSSEKQIIVGNGGAPLSGSVDYGWAYITQQSNNDIEVRAFDYMTGAELPEAPITLSP